MSKGKSVSNNLFDIDIDSCQEDHRVEDIETSGIENGLSMSNVVGASLSHNATQDAFAEVSFTKKDKLAVDIQNVAYSYNRKKVVLRNITLLIPEGKIFALLGSNGCGKTTMLRMVLGRLKPEHGYIKVFGVKPGTRNSQIPGAGVGYMPQNISLIPEFTIEETLGYFGQIYHMNSKEVRDRVDKLIELLNLPDRKQLVRKLSGGQKRLVSLAVTLVHKPPLVILDEPTVGVDSMLRYRIWNHLEYLCANEGTTVIITTHYIEEAKESNCVGFIESGTILAQSTPRQLQQEYQCNTLEEVFLKLCIHKYSKNSQKFGNALVPPNIQKHFQAYRENFEETKADKISFGERMRKEMDKERLKAMIWKSYIRVKRNPFILIMFHVIPIMTITLFTLTFLRSPHKMPIAIYPGDTNGGNLSQSFINILDEYFLKKQFFDSEEDALDAVRNGRAYYAMLFSDNFTEAFTSRYIDVYRTSVDDIDIESSKIRLYPDNSNFIFAVYMRRAVLNYFEVFMKQFSENLGYNPITFNIPIDVKKPIYGQMETDLGHYLVSALIVFSLYVLPMVIGSLQIIMDRKDGYQERAFVAGVKPLEVLTGHMLTCFLAVVSQVFVTIMLAFVIFELDNKGSLLEIFILIFLQGIQGLSIGLLISMVCSNEIFANMAVIGLVIPMLMTSGSMWPMEGLPDILQKFIFLNPITLTIRSVRLVMLRGWNYNHFQVLIGYLSTSLYTFITFLSSIFLFHFISNTNLRIPFLPHYN